ncbi:hypothetical protein QTP88_026550 [Uroleucon formosanum]
MFTCSICDETFGGIHHDSTYTTQCGHVFHYQCLMRWLKRSNTCPHCRSSVLENNLIKLFLQDDPNARVTWDRKTDEEINTLKEQLKKMQEKETHNSNSIYSLEAQLKHTKTALDFCSRSVNLFKTEAENHKRNISNISAELKLKTVHFNESEIDRKKLQAGYSLLQLKIKSLKREFYDLQSVNSSVIDELKLEIAELKSEKVYLQSRCNNIENINVDQPSTSKMHIENKNATSLQNQTKREYCGHDPESHISTEKFLFGCVFFFANTCIKIEGSIYNNILMFKDYILKYGGLVEPVYNARITHVIVGTQENYIFEKSIKDGKRCVTNYWLTDIFSKKSMIPPWLAIHFPTPYRIDNLPCQHFKIAVVNFGKNESHKIGAMIELVGGDYTKEVTPRTDIVICLKSEGELVEKALAMNKPVVNVQWLNGILFGEKLGIKEPGNSKYRQFDLFNPFSVNYDMVSHLMEAWKTPLSCYKNQQVYDMTSNPDSPTKCKRQKTISKDQNLTNLINDDNDVIITYMKNTPKPCVMFCGFSTENEDILTMIILFFGGKVANNFFEATHLVMNKSSPSINFYGCLSTVKYILNENWLKDSHSRLQLQNEKDYIIVNIIDKYLGLCHLPLILQRNDRHLLFKDLSFFITPGIIYPSSDCLEQIVSSAGGTIERTRRSLESIRGLASNSYFIISCQEDHYLYNDLLDIDNVVYSSEFITCSVLAQEVKLQQFLLNVTA